MGNVALAGGFLKETEVGYEEKYPLKVLFCEDCFAVQVEEHVDPNVLFDGYFYFSSEIGTLRDHFIDYGTEVVSRFLSPEKATVLEFGCNDGVFLKPLADQGVRTLIGVDPASNIVSSINDSRIEIVNDYFTSEISREIREKYGAVDMVVANNVFAHIPDICDATKAVNTVLDDDGIFVFEVHYLGNVINGMQYDMIYHEHIYYYSLLALENHFKNFNMIIFDAKPTSIHGGSIRFHVCKNGSKYSRQISGRVDVREKRNWLLVLIKRRCTKSSHRRFKTKRNVNEPLNDLRSKGKISGYGASGRANTMIHLWHYYRSYGLHDR